MKHQSFKTLTRGPSFRFPLKITLCLIWGWICLSEGWHYVRLVRSPPPLLPPPPPLFLWLTDLPSVLKIPGEQGRRDGDETASLTLSHCNPSLYCLPASICLQLAPPNFPHCLSIPPTPHKSPVTGSDTPIPTHTYAHFPIFPSCLSFSLSCSPSLQDWAFKTSTAINLRVATVMPDKPLTHTSSVSPLPPSFISFISFPCLSLCHPT